MKKLYLLIFSVAFGGISFGQNAYTINTRLLSTADMVTPINTVVTGDTAEFFNADEFSTIVAPLLVLNNSGTSKNVKVKRTQLSIVSGSSNFFCWDLCYTPIVSISTGTVSIPANDTVFLFYADYNPNGNIGTSYINYKFFYTSDTTEFASATIKFTSGILDVEDEQAIIANVYPNPANSQITFDYILGHGDGSIVITDLTGKVVRTPILPSNSTKQVVDLTGLTDGIYIYTFYNGGKAISTRKFIIKK